jgi:hypothetical protein
MRPRAMCFCADVPAVHTKTELLILQHPRERLHPFGTARMVGLALPNARVLVPPARNDGSLCNPLPVPDDAAVLFPHPAAVDLATLPASEHPRVLVVLDGTWAHARRLYAHNSWLAGLRHVRLHPRVPSRYRIRKEPRADYVSTLEAVVTALQILEPDTAGLDDLLRAFTCMIDRQIEHLDVVPRHGRSRRPRQRPSRRLPALLDAPGLLVTYCEVVMPHGTLTRDRALVQWTAARADTGETFDVMLRPPVDAWPVPEHLAHMGFAAGDLEAGLTVEGARARFADFAGQDPVLACWGKNTLAWARDLLPPAARTCSLRVAYTNLRNRSPGLLDHVLACEDVPALLVPCRGRAAARLGNALALARWLRAQRRASDRAAW